MSVRQVEGKCEGDTISGRASAKETVSDRESAKGTQSEAVHRAWEIIPDRASAKGTQSEAARVQRGHRVRQHECEGAYA